MFVPAFSPGINEYSLRAYASCVMHNCNTSVDSKQCTRGCSCSCSKSKFANFHKIYQIYIPLAETCLQHIHGQHLMNCLMLGPSYARSRYIPDILLLLSAWMCRCENNSVADSQDTVPHSCHYSLCTAMVACWFSVCHSYCVRAAQLGW